MPKRLILSALIKNRLNLKYRRSITEENTVQTNPTTVRASEIPNDSRTINEAISSYISRLPHAEQRRRMDYDASISRYRNSAIYKQYHFPKLISFGYTNEHIGRIFACPHPKSIVQAIIGTDHHLGAHEILASLEFNHEHIITIGAHDGGAGNLEAAALCSGDMLGKEMDGTVVTHNTIVDWLNYTNRNKLLFNKWKKMGHRFQTADTSIIQQSAPAEPNINSAVVPISTDSNNRVIYSDGHMEQGHMADADADYDHASSLHHSPDVARYFPSVDANIKEEIIQQTGESKHTAITIDDDFSANQATSNTSAVLKREGLFSILSAVDIAEPISASPSSSRSIVRASSPVVIEPEHPQSNAPNDANFNKKRRTDIMVELDAINQLLEPLLKRQRKLNHDLNRLFEENENRSVIPNG